MKAFLVDTGATIVFFTIAASISELFVAGMHWTEVAITRLLMIPVMVLTARPYGVWRDWVFSRLKPQSPVARGMSDIAAFIVFQVPVYVVTLLVAGANLDEILKAVASAMMFILILGRPFGLFLDIARRWFGTAPQDKTA